MIRSDRIAIASGLPCDNPSVRISMLFDRKDHIQDEVHLGKAVVGKKMQEDVNIFNRQSWCSRSPPKAWQKV